MGMANFTVPDDRDVRRMFPKASRGEIQSVHMLFCACCTLQPPRSMALAGFLSIRLDGLEESRGLAAEQLLILNGFALQLEEPYPIRPSGEIGDTKHLVVLCIDKDPTDHHGLPIADIDLSVGFAAIDTWTSRIAPCANGISGCTNLHHDQLTDFLGIS